LATILIQVVAVGCIDHKNILLHNAIDQCTTKQSYRNFCQVWWN